MIILVFFVFWFPRRHARADGQLRGAVGLLVVEPFAGRVQHGGRSPPVLQPTFLAGHVQVHTAWFAGFVRPGPPPPPPSVRRDVLVVLVVGHVTGFGFRGRRSRSRRGRRISGIQRGTSDAVAAHTAQVHRTGHVRLSQLPGSRATGSSRRPPQEERAQLPYTRLRQSVRKDISSQGAPPMAHGREAVRVQLAVLRQAVHAVR